MNEESEDGYENKNLLLTSYIFMLVKLTLYEQITDGFEFKFIPLLFLRNPLDWPNHLDATGYR